MAQTEKKRDFKVLAEKIAPDNVLIMAELLAIKETKTLVKFMGQHAIRAHAALCTDVFCKDMPDYTLSDKMFWTFSTLGAGPQHSLYFKAEVSCFELNLREESLKRYTTKDYDYIFVQGWGRTSDCGYKYTVTKGPYPHCAFHTNEELNEYLSLYEAVEEPYFDNDSMRKKYWILKSAFVSVWTEDEFGKIKADRTETSMFNGRHVPTKYIKCIIFISKQGDKINLWMKLKK